MGANHTIDHRSKIADEGSDTAEESEGVLAVIERPDRSLAEPGRTLAQGRSILAKMQTKLISKQMQFWLSSQVHCPSGAALRHKDTRHDGNFSRQALHVLSPDAFGQAVPYALARESNIGFSPDSGKT